MAERDCNKNVIASSSKQAGDLTIHATAYALLDVDQILECTPLSDGETAAYVSTTADKSMSITFSRTDVGNGKHQYELSFANGTDSKMRRVVGEFERRLGPHHRRESKTPEVRGGIRGDIVGFLWDVPVA